MFFTYSQNNSGGSFVYDESAGISHYVIVEADSPRDADARAGLIGLYFDGDGDCPCCGSRWCETYDEGSEQPMVYDSFLDDSWKPSMKWMKGYEAFVHYKSGTFQGYCK